MINPIQIVLNYNNFYVEERIIKFSQNLKVYYHKMVSIHIDITKER